MKAKLAPEYSDPKELLELWKSYRKEILECIQITPDSEFTTTPKLGGWSISEIAEHLYLTQRTIALGIKGVLSGKFGFDCDSQPNLSYREIRASLSKPRGVKNPDSLTPLSKYSKLEAIEKLNKSEELLEKVVAGFKKEDLVKRGMTHMIFGDLNLFNFIWTMPLHENYHLYAMKQKTKDYIKK